MLRKRVNALNAWPIRFAERERVLAKVLPLTY